mgnify:CR=1 FL=1
MNKYPDVPRVSDLVWPCLQALRELGGSASNRELLQKVIEREGISDAVAGIMHKDGRRTRLAYNLDWTKSFLKKDGAIFNSSYGVWALTARGEGMSHDECVNVPKRVQRA